MPSAVDRIDAELVGEIGIVFSVDGRKITRGFIAGGQAMIEIGCAEVNANCLRGIADVMDQFEAEYDRKFPKTL